MTQVLGVRAVLGLLVVGMGLGGAAALALILSGGSYLAALALYSLVSTVFVLGAALLSFVILERKTVRETQDDALPEDPVAAAE